MALSNNSVSRNTNDKSTKSLSKSKVKAMVESYEARMQLREEAKYVRKVIMSCESLAQIESCNTLLTNLLRQYNGKVPLSTLEDVSIGLSTAIRVVREQLHK